MWCRAKLPVQDHYLLLQAWPLYWPGLVWSITAGGQRRGGGEAGENEGGEGEKIICREEVRGRRQGNKVQVKDAMEGVVGRRQGGKASEGIMGRRQGNEAKEGGKELKVEN